MKTKTTTLFLLAGLGLSAAYGCQTASLRSGEAVPMPIGYRNWHHVKSMLIQPGHALYDSFGGLHHVYANAAAERGLASGQYDDGAVFVFDLLAAESGGNAVQEGKRKVLGVMHKSAAAFPETGGWGFAGFADGKNVVTDMRGQCFQCHESQKQTGFVFSKSRP